MPSGTIVKTDEKGFGFIRSSAHSQDMFFHVTGLQDRADFDLLEEGDRVNYEIDDSGDRPRAVQVVPQR